MIIETTIGRYKLGKNTSLVLPEKLGEKIEIFFEPPASFEESLKEILTREITYEEIEKSLGKLPSLTLELTQSCNLRCKYCVFGDNYEFFRSHSAKKMSLSTAKEAIDFLYKHMQAPFRTDRIPAPMTLVFFGGESLLEFDTMMKSVSYAENHPNRKFVDLDFQLSTNGILLDSEKVKWLVDKDFVIYISLDGPESEHDRFRVFKDGTGSFKKVLENVKFIKREYPEYYSRNVVFLLTVHPYHDFKKTEEFFLSNESYFNTNNTRIIYLRSFDLKDPELRDARDKMPRKQVNALQKDKWFYKKVVMDSIDHVLDSETQFLSLRKNFTRTCFPGGDRLLVNPDGEFHICEKINGQFVIGDLKRGFDIPKIKKMFEQWRKLTLKLECWKCDNIYFCPFCFANGGDDGKFVVEKEECQKQVDLLYHRVYDYLVIKETENEATESNHNLNLSDFLESL